MELEEGDVVLINTSMEDSKIFNLWEIIKVKEIKDGRLTGYVVDSNDFEITEGMKVMYSVDELKDKSENRLIKHRFYQLEPNVLGRF